MDVPQRHRRPSVSVRVVTGKRKPWSFVSQHDVARFIALVKRFPKLQTCIAPERLLLEWEKLEPVTGIAAKCMCQKWKRLCDKYRSELRREMKTPPDQSNSKWVHFERMSFVRDIELKRIRMHNGKEKLYTTDTEPESSILEANSTVPKRYDMKNQMPFAVPLNRVNVESTSPKRFVVKKPVQPCGGGSPAASCSYTQPSLPVNKLHKEAQPRKLIHMPTGHVTVLGCSEQSVLQDLQEQAERFVSMRPPVHRVPITDPLFQTAHDNDYDFLIMRIYPLLGLFPMEMKRFCYETVQQFIIRLAEVVDRLNRKTNNEPVI
ncbi:uncharacterized protein LOC126567524 [Anopheles maculipalpis]|uniref:uncharacterized protein LOC126567524 n=1 Tax=Anopheles maculipalpis TaxID=1496333 RepID=UPI0021593AC2|nr:uncharacterized protein LOC126567524 [Anopheles maculipalpis]